MKGMGNMMKQAQKMQAKMMKLQNELDQFTAEGSAGGGAVTAVANGKQQVLSVTINPEVVDPEDVEILQDMVTAAVNDALTKVSTIVNEKMSKVTGGMNIPGLM
ncbi:MAG: YbaB/EbfC family nucleoid-associated protein [Desulfobacterales bacterium]|nr:YbaB/EbfC family nucleoid-associated protein [Desulfobacterales bacterium]